MPWTGIVGLLVGLLPVPAPSPVDEASARPRVAWRHAAEGWGEPTLAGDTVFFLGRQHEVMALEAATGRLLWRVSTGGVGDAPLGSAVRATGSLVLAGDGAVVALSRSNGRPAWRFAPAGDTVGPYLGAASERTLFVGSIRGRLYALDVTTGRPRWTQHPAGGKEALVFAPATAGGIVVASYSVRGREMAGGVGVFDGDGRRLWHRTLPAGVAPTGPAVVTGHAVVVSGSDGTLHAWNLRTGRRAWGAPGVAPRPGRDGSADMRPLVSVAGLVVAGSVTGRLVAYDGGSGREMWRYEPGEDVAVMRLRAHGETLFAPYTDDSVLAFEATTGRLIWRVGDANERVEWPPAAAGSRAYAAGVNNLIAWDVVSAASSAHSSR